MPLDTLLEQIPDYAKDLKLNLSSALRVTELSEVQKWGAVVASLVALRCDKLSEELLPEASEKLSEGELRAAKIAGSLMGMNNVYYRFGHLSSNAKYLQLPAKLRMNAMQNLGVEKSDFELWSLVVSAINACGLCIDSHEKVLREHGFSEEQVLAAVRLGAVLNALAGVFDIERV